MREFTVKDRQEREPNRQYVDPRLLETPVVDVLTSRGNLAPGSDGDDTWFYLDFGDSSPSDLGEKLFEEARPRYSYRVRDAGRTARAVEFDPATSHLPISIRDMTSSERMATPQCQRWRTS